MTNMFQSCFFSYKCFELTSICFLTCFSNDELVSFVLGCFKMFPSFTSLYRFF